MLFFLRPCQEGLPPFLRTRGRSCTRPERPWMVIAMMRMPTIKMRMMKKSMMRMQMMRMQTMRMPTMKTRTMRMSMMKMRRTNLAKANSLSTGSAARAPLVNDEAVGEMCQLRGVPAFLGGKVKVGASELKTCQNLVQDTTRC